MLPANTFIGHNIKKWRMFKGMKQETLASLLGVSKSTVSQTENGKIDITVSRIEEIANHLNINPMQLLSSPQVQIHDAVNVSIERIYSNGDASLEEIISLFKKEVEQKNRQLEEQSHLILQLLNERK